MTQQQFHQRRVSIRRAGLCLASTVFVLATAWTVPQAAGPQQQGATAAAPSPVAGHAAVVKEYCASCHSSRLKTADLSLEGVSLDNVAANAEMWEKVVR